jgi:hypothetical protein
LDHEFSIFLFLGFITQPSASVESTGDPVINEETPLDENQSSLVTVFDPTVLSPGSLGGGAEIVSPPKKKKQKKSSNVPGLNQLVWGV